MRLIAAKMTEDLDVWCRSFFEWNSVKECCPELNRGKSWAQLSDKVLVLTENNELTIATFGEASNVIRWVLDDGTTACNSDELERVTHWMPLPKTSDMTMPPLNALSLSLAADTDISDVALVNADDVKTGMNSWHDMLKRAGAGKGEDNEHEKRLKYTDGVATIHAWKSVKEELPELREQKHFSETWAESEPVLVFDEKEGIRIATYDEYGEWMLPDLPTTSKRIEKWMYIPEPNDCDREVIGNA